MSTVRQQMPRSSWRRWSVTASMLVMAVVYLIAGWIGSGPALGLALFALTLCFTVVIEISMRRSELVKGLGRPP